MKEPRAEDRVIPGSEFQGEIVVVSRIVDYLSSGLYESPAAALKELVNNSFDADATRVDIFIKPDANIISIEDNGEGMSRDEFVKHFSRISESYKREKSDTTARGRLKIGKIGIGFIAANELCDIMEIVSTKRGSNELLQVTINFEIMRQEVDVRKRTGFDYATADYHGYIGVANPQEHYTQVFLKQIRGEAREVLAGAGHSRYGSGVTSLYGFTPKSIWKKLSDSELRTWSSFDPYSINMLRVALNVPVPYHENWMPDRLRAKVHDIEKRVRTLDFSVFMDNSELRKPIVFSQRGKALIDRFAHQGNQVGAEGYFYAQHGAIAPQELQGLLIRIRNAAVGGYDPTFLGFSSSLGPLFQKWISAEIYADDKLEEAMNIDRRTLRVTHPAYIELQRAVHEHLIAFIGRVRTQIYGQGSEIRQREQAERIEASLEQVATQTVAPVAPKAAKQLKSAWDKAAGDEIGRRRLLKKFTVDKLYRLVVDVAKNVMTSTQLEDFLVQLTRRLRE